MRNRAFVSHFCEGLLYVMLDRLSTLQHLLRNRNRNTASMKSLSLCVLQVQVFEFPQPPPSLDCILRVRVRVYPDPKEGRWNRFIAVLSRSKWISIALFEWGFISHSIKLAGIYRLTTYSVPTKSYARKRHENTKSDTLLRMSLVSSLLL